MKRTFKKTFVSRDTSKQGAVTDKNSLIRQATRFTLEQYAKTFKDLARYDRTAQATR